MKSLTQTSLVAASLLTVSASSGFAATFSLQTSFFDFGTTTNVGTGLFTYESPAAFADGSYVLTSFTSPTFSFIFSGPESPTSFSIADLAPDTAIGIDISGNQFNFTHLNGGNEYTNGSADFYNTNGDHLSLSPNAPGQDYGILGVRAAYHLEYSGSAYQYEGSYGIGSSSVAVPEPSTYGLLGIGALGVAFAARRRKLKKA